MGDVKDYDTMNEGLEVIVCTCCGATIRNDKEQNLFWGMSPYPSDYGYGHCFDCVR